MDLLHHRGHEWVVTARDKDVTLDLLHAYGIPYRSLSRLPTRRWLIPAEFVFRVSALLQVCRRERPDVLAGIMGPTAAVAGTLLGIPSVVYYSNESTAPLNRLTQFLASEYLAPWGYRGPVGGRVRRVRTFQEWAYTSPRVFTPDPETWSLLDLFPGSRYFVVRLVAWRSIHDVGAHGIHDPLRLVRALEPHGRVFVSSEKPLPPELAPYALPVPPDKGLDVLALASLYVGESVTMATEAALLGTPAVYVSYSFRGVTAELERAYGLALNFKTLEQGLDTILTLARRLDAKDEWAARRSRFMEHTDDFNEVFLDALLRSQHSH